MTYHRIVATVIDRPDREGVTVTFTNSDGDPDTVVHWMANSMAHALDWVEVTVKESLLIVTPLDDNGAYSVAVLDEEA